MSAEQKQTVISCLCGAVEVTCKGDLVATYACHCKTCRHGTGAPFFAYSVYSGGCEITKGADHVHVNVVKGGDIERSRCQTCGSLMHLVKAKQIIVVPAGHQPYGSFKLTGHQFYEERIMDVPDDAKKFIGSPWVPNPQEFVATK